MALPLLEEPDIARVLFHPRREDPAAIPARGVQPVYFEVEPGLAVGGMLHASAATAPATLFFHGNGEIAAEYAEIAKQYTDLGITFLVADYRGYGRSGGAPTAGALLADAVAVFDGLESVWEEHGLAPEGVYVMGRSLGTVCAIEIASQRGDRLAGLIIESGFADTFSLVARLGGDPRCGSEEEDGFRNAQKIESIEARTLVIHGEEDRIIPASEGKELYERSAAPDKHLELIPQSGHNDLFYFGFDQYFSAMRRFVKGEGPAK